MRANGIPFDVIFAPYKGTQMGDPTFEDITAFAEQYIDASDPDRNHPVVLTDEDELLGLMPFAGGHPKHCIFSPEREIVWCEHGYNLENTIKRTVNDLWSAR